MGKSMKIGTLVVFDMLNPNLPGAKAYSQWRRHIGQFKMAAEQKPIFPNSAQKSHTVTNKSTFLGFLDPRILNLILVFNYIQLGSPFCIIQDGREAKN